ncbi:MAG: HAMP domain-containing sensor histidine kinase [Pseudomonadales bacterium]|jgi:signal transduction histidine kinase
MSEEQRARFLHNIAADAQRLHRLTERLMELTRAEIHTPDSEPFKLAEVIEESVRAYSEQVAIDTNGVSAGAIAFGQPDALNAVLEVLFENAIQHHANQVTVWAQEDSGGVDLFVRDDGGGISDANRAKVFDPFFTTEREQGGTGLGLTIATALLKQTHGELRLDGGDGPTTFRITLRGA